MCEDGPSITDGGSTRDDAGDRPQEDRLPVEQHHRVLANTRRRQILSHLRTRESTSTTVDTLVEVVAESEFPEPGPRSHRSRIEAELHHVHLPKLADTGVIEYDPVAEVVRYDSSERLERLLEVSQRVAGQE